jgi:protein TonB
MISCDYARGPLYRLAEADMERFQRAMAQRKGPGQTVAGFFRSHTRKGISLDADDLAFYQACFKEPHHIGLLVRPFATKASTAGIFIWENGKIHSEGSYLEFPFHAADLGGKASESPAPESKAPAPSQPQSQPQASTSAAKPAARAQIVPIQSRRDSSQPAEPAPAPSAPPPPPPVAAAPVSAPPPPKVEEKPAPAEQKGKYDKFDKQGKKDTKPAEPAKPAASAPAPVKPAASPAPAAPAKSTALTVPATPVQPPAKTAAPAKTVEKPAAAVDTPKSGKGMKLVLAALATVALFVVLFVYPGLMRHNTKAPVLSQGDTSPLQLRVERSNGELLLTWNRDTDAIRNATKATLLISDGEQHENIDMDLSQLRNNGSIVYSPSSSDVSFKMEVIGRDQSKTASEIVRILRTKQSPLETQQADAKTVAAPAATKTASLPSAPNTPNNPATQVAATPATPSPVEEQVQEPVKPVVPRKEFNTASLAQRIRPAASSDIPDAPTAGGAASAAIPGVNLPSAGAIPSAPIAPPTASRSPAPAAAPVTMPDTKGGAKQGGQIQQAVLVTRKEPEYPKIAKQTGAKGVVTLNATIGKDGHIKAVKVVSGHPMLQNAAVEAVKQWIYKPTLLNGTPVETETQIMLNFVGER